MIKVWIDVGQPDEKRMRRACGRADQVFVYAYGGHGSTIWWDKVGGDVERCGNLTVVQLPPAACQGLAKQAQRNMNLNCTIQDGQVWMADAQGERAGGAGDHQGPGRSMSRCLAQLRCAGPASAARPS